MTVVDGLLADRYRLGPRIATGGMGEVWRAKDVVLDRDVAVKTLRAEFTDDEDFRIRFRAEARHAARLSHPGIASVYDFGESADRAWLVMELVEGEPLSALLHREGALSPERTLEVIAQTAAALQVAHDGGVVHRDVKPGNLLLRPDGVVKVTDFGIASAVDAAPVTRTGEVVGTAYYLSPEQARGDGAAPASDLYALGVVAFECLSGSRPFPGDNAVAVATAHLHSPPPALPASVPAPLAALVLRLLSKDPGRRPASAGQLAVEAAALRERLADGSAVPGGATRVLPLPTAATTSPDPGSPHLPPRRTAAPVPSHMHRRAVRLAAVVLAVLALGLGLSALGQDPVDAPSTDTEQQPAGPTPVQVSAEQWLGQPAAVARDGLAAQGLVPRLIEDGAGRPVGTVSGVDPVGDLAAGTTVVLHVVPAPPPEPVRQPEGDRREAPKNENSGDDKKGGKRR
ncbi:MAG: protein kinase [Actinomycetota bacterium]|nr:protein kinase [Actinomycetota bacterium]